ncbi:MAG: hypothetical protein NT056_07260 [Proteobacteria bacterium]|nr:hypothetical protein [Pseudomonadota bacterium]
MLKKYFLGKRHEGIFKAALIKLDQPPLAVLILAGDGTSDSLQANLESGESFTKFICQNLPAGTTVIVDAENLIFAGSLLLGILGNLYHEQKTGVSFVTGDDLEVRKKLEQLTKLYCVEDKGFSLWLDDTLDKFQVDPALKEEILGDKFELGGIANFSPEVNFVRRAMGTGEKIDANTIKMKNHLEHLYQEGFFRIGSQENALILTAPVLQMIAFLYCRDVLAKHNLYIEKNAMKGKIERSELEWLVYEILENSRVHGYSSANLGIVFIHYLARKDNLFLIFEDHGGAQPSTYQGAQGAMAGVKKLLESKFSLDANSKPAYALNAQKGVEVSPAEIGLRLEKARNISQFLFQGRSPVEEIGPGYRVTITLPLA